MFPDSDLKATVIDGTISIAVVEAKDRAAPGGGKEEKSPEAEPTDGAAAPVSEPTNAVVVEDKAVQNTKPDRMGTEDKAVQPASTRSQSNTEL